MAKTTQLNSVANVPVTPTLKPTRSGTNSGLSGPNLPARTSSPNAQAEKIFEPANGSSISKG